MTTRKQITKYKAANKTLEHLGYSYHGGEMWAPPIGTKPNFDLIDRLRADTVFDKILIKSLQDSLAVRTRELEAEIAKNAELKHENHNLNVALGTTGYEEADWFTADERVTSTACNELIQARIERMQAQKAKLEEQAKDAARYRWLRDEDNWGGIEGDRPGCSWAELGELTHGEFDNYIDTAIAENAK